MPSHEPSSVVEGGEGNEAVPDPAKAGSSVDSRSPEDSTVVKDGSTVSSSSSSLGPLPQLPHIDMRKAGLIGTTDVRSTLAKGRKARRQAELAGKVADPKVEEDDGYLYHEKQHYTWEVDPKKLVLKNFIAKGTFGTVHRGTYAGRDVAVKLLDWGADDSMNRAELLEVREAFVQEVSLWSTLSHPNVTQFIGAILGGAEGFHIPSTVTGHDGHVLVEGHVSCVVLEFLPNGSLKKTIYSQKHKKLAYKLVLQYALDIARGLAYLHSKQVVHRDVKPDNMLLDKHNVVKIADFGVSRVETPFEMQEVAGTYGYMAPEVLLGKPYDHKVDVYSFGVMLWEIYCCENPLPFMHFNENDIKAFVSQGLRPEIPSCCPADLASLMQRCWDKDPQKRPDMAEVVHLLEHLDPHKGSRMATNEVDEFLNHSHHKTPWLVNKVVEKFHHLT